MHRSLDLTEVNTLTDRAAGLTRTYEKIGAAYRLTRIADANGNAISIAFNARGNVASVTNGAATLALGCYERAGQVRPPHRGACHLAIKAGLSN